MSRSFLFSLYFGVSQILSPLARLYLHRRARKGKEDPQRLQERWGVTSLPRPSRVLWFHAASLGETLSLIPLWHQIHQDFPHITLLVTTITTSAARLLEKQKSSLPPLIHQYAPLDVPSWIHRFLEHWRPELALITESEVWPNWLDACQKRKIPVLSINTRLTERSMDRWGKLPSPVRRQIFGGFELCLAQTEALAQKLREFGVPQVIASGNLKFAAAPLSCDETALAELCEQIQKRPVWVAASTHSGEEEQIIEAHKQIKSQIPKILTIMVPRHIERREIIRNLLQEQGVTASFRSQKEVIIDQTDVYVADTLGELGLFYHLSPLALIGGSLVPNIGGHNPIEAAQCNCALLWGPYYHKSTDLYNRLQPSAWQVASPEELAQAVTFLLTHPEEGARRAQEAQEIVHSERQVLEIISQEIYKRLSKSLPGVIPEASDA